MKSKASKPGRPLKLKVASNPLLPPQLQGMRYRVCGFMIQPIIMYYTPTGEEDQEVPAEMKFQMRQSTFKKTLPEILTESGLKMESDK